MEKPTTDRHFSKSERLCGEIRTTRLFSEGKGFIVYPLRVVYRESGEQDSDRIKVLVSVPKKKLKRAVDRNRVKRLIREAYRNNKQYLLTGAEAKNIYLHIGIIYLDTALPSYTQLEERLKTAFKKILTGLTVNQYEN
jgi:ribonuclease P protein component